ncbi:hypothetical protein AB3Z07_05130 [Metabacillus halosaccharovorans]|uniref:hypothetical protein n=1 Tax=Metabacillus halosaccharovorans TaxID=930124 RepID=UPI0034CFCA4D
MYWYHWIAVYLLIIGAVIFVVIPEKTLWLWGVILFMFISGLLLGVLLPHKEDKYARVNKEG